MTIARATIIIIVTVIIISIFLLLLLYILIIKNAMNFQMWKPLWHVLWSIFCTIPLVGLTRRNWKILCVTRVNRWLVGSAFAETPVAWSQQWGTRYCISNLPRTSPVETAAEKIFFSPVSSMPPLPTHVAPTSSDMCF